MAQGWLRLHRSMADHWLWTEDRVFSKAEAWFDLLMMVNHTDGKVMMNGKLMEVKAGSRITSIKELSERWKWSRKKVANYFNLLQNDGMIAFASTSKYTLVTVLNWAFYQGESEIRNIKSTSEEHQENITGTTEAHRKHTNNNDKNNNNDNNDEEKDIYSQSGLFEDVPDQVQMIFDKWNAQGITVHRSLTPDIAKAIEKALRQYGGNRCGEAIDLYSDAYYDQGFYYSHKWTLAKFMTQSNGMKDWLEDGQRYVEYNDYLDRPANG